MKKEDILASPSMPLAGPSYPHGPYRFVDREYMIIIYESDPDAIRAAVPEPLIPDQSNQVFYEWIKMPDSSGFGDYTESGVVIPCHYDSEPCNFVAQMYLDNDPPIAAGREIWGFPKKYAHPKVEVVEDTLTGRLSYAGVEVAIGTMGYKFESHVRNPEKAQAALTKTQYNLKLIDGKPATAQLVKYNLINVTVKGSWSAPACLHLIPYENAPVADLPVRKVITGRHIIADLTLPYGEVAVDYLA